MLPASQSRNRTTSNAETVIVEDRPCSVPTSTGPLHRPTPQNPSRGLSDHPFIATPPRLAYAVGEPEGRRSCSRMSWRFIDATTTPSSLAVSCTRNTHIRNNYSEWRRARQYAHADVACMDRRLFQDRVVKDVERPALCNALHSQHGCCGMDTQGETHGDGETKCAREVRHARDG
jgi:hypothetical protein